MGGELGDGCGEHLLYARLASLLASLVTAAATSSGDTRPFPLFMDEFPLALPRPSEMLQSHRLYIKPIKTKIHFSILKGL